MSRTGPVTTLTDELIAELDENAKGWCKTEVHPSDAARLVNLISELKRDAERYRWLIKCTGSSIANLTPGSSLFSDEDIDNAIDTAMATN